MAPKRRVPQRQPSSQGERSKDRGAQASIGSSHTRVLGMSPIIAHNVSSRRVIDFEFFEREDFEIGIKIRNLG